MNGNGRESDICVHSRAFAANSFATVGKSMIASRFCILVVPGLLCAQSTSVLNMSHDLVPKGIAAQNLHPDTATLDARPLVEAAVAYASRNAIATVTADSGSYYFLTLHANGASQHVLL